MAAKTRAVTDPALEQAKRLKRTRRDKAAAEIGTVTDPAVLAHLAEIDLRFDTGTVTATNPATPELALWTLHRRALTALLAAPARGHVPMVLTRTVERLDPDEVLAELAAADTGALDRAYNGGRYLYPYRELAVRLLKATKGHWERDEWVPDANPHPEADRLAAATAALRLGPAGLAWEVAALVADGRVPGVESMDLVSVGAHTPVVLAATAGDARHIVDAELAEALVAHAAEWPAAAAHFDHFDNRGWRRPTPTETAAHILAACNTEWARLWATKAPLERTDRLAIITAPGTSHELLTELTRTQDIDAEEGSLVLARALKLRANHESGPLLRSLMLKPGLAGPDRAKAIATLAKQNNPGVAVNWLTANAAGPRHETIPVPGSGDIEAFAAALTPRAAKAVVTRLGDGAGMLGSAWACEALDNLPMLCVAPSERLRQAVKSRIAVAGLDRAELAAARDLLAGWEGSLIRLLATAKRDARRAASIPTAAERSRDAGVVGKQLAARAAQKPTTPSGGPDEESLLATQPARKASLTTRRPPARTAPRRAGKARRAAVSVAGRPPRWLDVAVAALEALGGEVNARQVVEWNDTAGPRRPHAGKTPAQTVNRDMHAAVRVGHPRLQHGSRPGTFTLARSS